MRKIAILLMLVTPIIILISCGGPSAREVICDYIIPEKPQQQEATQQEPTIDKTTDVITPIPSNPDQSTIPELTKKELYLPKVVKLGRDNCLPCIQMNEILAQVRTIVGSKAVVEIIDVSINPDAAYQYGIRVIPTEIFFNTNGDEIYRFEGVMPKEEVLNWLNKGGGKF